MCTFKNILPLFLLSALTFIPVYADDAVFSNSETQQFDLQPLNYNSVPVVKSQETSSSVKTVQTADSQNQVSNTNFLNAINNLDNAQVEIREQMASTSALMSQSKTAYESRRDEYRAYKKQYRELKSKMRSVEKSKNMIRNNVNVNNGISN